MLPPSISYDVFLANVRGNVYSRDHTTLNSSAKPYWDWTFDEHIKFDLPAMIDYVTRFTKRDQIAYIGYSQGTLMMFGLMATQPKYNDIVKPFIALAPVTTINYVQSPIKYLTNVVTMTFLKYRGGPFFADTRLLKVGTLSKEKAASLVMSQLLGRNCPGDLKDVCSNVVFLLVGFNQEQFNYNRSAAFLSHMPAGSSTKNLLHFAQLYKAKRFQQFDYGAKENEQRYGQQQPREYNVTAISNKFVCLMHSKNDYLASPDDVRLLKSKLSPGVVVDDYTVSLPSWNHLDFQLGKDAGLHVNQRVVKLLQQYN